MTEPTPSPEIDELLAYRGWVRRLCRQLVRSEVEAEDVEQETWRRALESPPRHRGNLKAWLATVARSAAMQSGRQAGASRAGEESLRQDMQADADAEHAGSDRRDGPDATAEQRETFALLHRLLIDLEAPYGEVVFLRYVQGLPPRRIAKRLDLPVATVKTRLNRGLEILRRRTRKQLGADWRNRCMVFVPSLPSVAATTLTTTIAMSKPIKLTLAAAAVLLAVPIYSVLENDRGIDEVKESTEAEASAAKPLMDPVADALVAVPPPESDAPRVEQALPAPSGPPLRIVVKDRLTRKPVVGAEVFVLDLGHPQLELERFDKQRSRSFYSESRLRDFGTQFETNELGEVEVPGVYSDWQVQVCASTEASYDHVFLSDLGGQDTVQVELLLRERIDRTVEVVDANGTPVVGQQVAWLLASSGGWDHDPGTIMLTNTDAEGRAYFRNMQVRGSDFEGHSVRHAMNVRFGSVNPVLQEFDLFERDSRSIRLQLPPSVVLNVQIDEDLREQCIDGLLAGLCAVPEGETRKSFFDTGGRWRSKVFTEILNGEAVFPAVEPGFLGYIMLQVEDEADFVLQRVEIAADAQGEQIVVVHRPKQDDGIEFVIVDQQGESLDTIPWDIVAFELRDALEIRHALRSRPGSAGSLRLREAQDYVRDFPHDRDYLVRVVSKGDASDVRFARFKFDAALLTPSEQFVRVEISDHLVVSGRVLNQAGAPITGARVMLRGGNYYHPGTGEYFPESIYSTTNEQGEFQIRGDQLSTSRLTVTAPDSVPVDFQFVQGAANQEFNVVVSPELKGVILTDSHVPPGALRARLDPLQEGTQVGGVGISTATGELRSRHSSSGQFQLVIEDTLRQEVFRSEMIELQEGVVEPDSLNPIDLRGKLYVHHLQVIGSDGEDPARFSIREVEQDWLKEYCLSPLTLVTAVDRLRVVVDAVGYKLSEPTELIGEQTIRLSREVSVRIDLPDNLVLANDRYEWTLRFEAARPNAYGWKPVRGIYLDHDGTAVDLPSAGEWKAQLKFQRIGTRAARAGMSDEFDWGSPVAAFLPNGLEFSIPAGTEEWVLSLPLSQEVLDKVVAGN